MSSRLVRSFREMMDVVVRDVEYYGYNEEDEEDCTLGWSTAEKDKNLRRRFVVDVCKEKDLTSLRRMLDSDWDVNENFRDTRETFTSFGSIVLHDRFRGVHEATRQSWLEGVDALVKAGADINCFDYRDDKEHGFSHTPLMHAANNGDERILQYLLVHGAKVNAQDPLTHISALLLAAVAGNVSCVQILIGEGADVNVVSQNNQSIPSTPLLAAVYYYRLPQWHHLSHEWRSSGGRERSRRQALSLMRMLIEAGCDVDMHGTDLPPLHNSATCKDPRALQLLLESGVSVNVVTAQKDHKCRSVALADAAIANNLVGVRLLIQYGSNLNDIDNTCMNNDGDPEVPLLVRVMDKKYYDIAATLVYAGWRATKAEQKKMAEICTAKQPSSFDAQANGSDSSESSEDEEEAAAALNAELLNMSERSRTKRLKLEALRWALNFLSGPTDLRWSCRLAIRNSMRSCSPDYVEQLPLPVRLKKYVMCCDL